MLKIEVPSGEIFDERTNRFITIRGRELQLEHSLVSLSKWESKWKKPFLECAEMTHEETVDYVRCMTISQNVDPSVYDGLTDKNLEEVRNYINDPMTATTFRNAPNARSGGHKIITSEIIYSWMISLEIPVEFQKWHLNRLMTLIRVCKESNSPGKKMSQRDVINQYRSLNQARRAKTGSRG